MDLIGTKTNGQSPPKGLKSEQMLPLCMGTEDLQHERDPSIPACGVLSSRALTLTAQKTKGYHHLNARCLYLEGWGTVSDEGLPTPSSTHQPPEQPFLTAHGQWQVVGLMVGGTQAPKIPIWYNTLFMSGTSE